MMKSWNFGECLELTVNGGAVRYMLRDIAVEPGAKVNLKKDFDADFTGGFTGKADALQRVAENRQRLAALQELLYAHNQYGLLVIFQGMDTSGKDGAIRHVLSGVNPQGCSVTSFKKPSEEELDHDYLWRIHKAAPRRGTIGVFNRSHYEEVLVVRVHEQILAGQRLPAEARGPDVWAHRYEDINNFEKYLTRNGIVVLKFFLNISRKEQSKRLVARIDDERKNWKFSLNDFKERALWPQYQKAYEQLLEATSTPWAPWFVIPADNKWFARLAISEIIAEQLEGMNLAPPVVSPDTKAALLDIREKLKAEGGRGK
jgi:PPK2 family polyphosphate:nucleotide phosphotransferase